MTSLEYYNNDWHLKYFNEKDAIEDEEIEPDEMHLNSSEKILFKVMFDDILSDN